MLSILKHDQYAAALYAKLKDQYSSIYRNIPLFSARNRLIGEIDMIAVSDSSVDIFEIKCSFRPIKARRQLQRIRKILCGEIDLQVNLYFYHGQGAQLVKIE